MNAARDDLLDRMRTRYTPDDAEAAHLAKTVEKMVAEARGVARAFEAEGTPTFEPLVVGSTAKGTWLPGQVDIDLFLMFDASLDRETLESLGLRAGKEILPRWTLRYAEHPYVHGIYDGYDADVVPAYAVDDARAIQSAVDRTPFHNAYVLAALKAAPERRDDIRVMKAWLKGIDVYGAETAQGGISGYLTEVLTLHHGGFLRAVEAFRGYRPGTRIDPAGRGASFPADTLIVIDPVDTGRNAAGAVRADRLQRLNAAADAFLEAPSERFFEPVPLPTLDPERARRALGSDGAVLLTFPVPDMREDAMDPHLRRAAESLGRLLEKEGFGIRETAGGLSTDAARAYLFVRTRPAELPETRIHFGPPATSGARADDFRQKYADHPDVMTPVHEREDHGRMRLAVVLRQHDRSLASRVDKALSRKVSLGKHATKALRSGYEVLDVAQAVAAPDLERVVARLMCAVPPWDRTGDPDHDYGVAGGRRSGASG